MPAQSYYVVFMGRRPGVYDSWAECQREVSGFKHALYKKFRSRHEANDALHNYRKRSDIQYVVKYNEMEYEQGRRDDQMARTVGAPIKPTILLFVSLLVVFILGYYMGRKP